MFPQHLSFSFWLCIRNSRLVSFNPLGLLSDMVLFYFKILLLYFQCCNSTELPQWCNIHQNLNKAIQLYNHAFIYCLRNAVDYLIKSNLWCQLLYFLDDDDNDSTSTRDDEEGDSSANILVYCGELVSAVLEMKDSHGRVICHLFKKLPPESVSIVSIDRFHCHATKK